MKRTNLPARLCAGLTALTLALTLTACGASAGGSASIGEAFASIESSANTTSDSALSQEAGEVNSTMDPAAVQTDRKIIYTASLDMESTEFDTARTAVLEAVDANGGYLASSDQYGSAEDQDRYIYYSVRIPAENYRAFLESVGNAGNLLNLSESTEDITTQYIDVQARLTALENQRDRLNALAEKAETTADLLEIESQLSEVQYQIESYTQQQRWMDDQVSYSTVDISLREVASLTPETPVTFAQKLGQSFSSGWTNFVELMGDLLLALVYMWPLVILLILVVIVLRITRPARRARREAKEARRSATRSGNSPYTYPVPPVPGDPGQTPPVPDPEEGTPKY